MLNTILNTLRHGDREIIVSRRGKPERVANPRLGVFDRVPRIGRITVEADNGAKALTLDELGKFLAAIAVATLPRFDGMAAPDWWERLILFTVMTGMRINDVLAARGDWINDDVLVVPRDHSKKRTEKEVYPLSKAALRIIDELEPLRLERRTRLLFAWTASDGYFHHTRRAILLRAGLTPPEADRLKMHGLRGLLATELPSDAAAQSQLNHADKRTTLAHYRNKTQEHRREVEAVSQRIDEIARRIRCERAAKKPKRK